MIVVSISIDVDCTSSTARHSIPRCRAETGFAGEDHTILRLPIVHRVLRPPCCGRACRGRRCEIIGERGSTNVKRSPGGKCSLITHYYQMTFVIFVPIGSTGTTESGDSRVAASSIRTQTRSLGCICVGNKLIENSSTYFFATGVGLCAIVN